MQRAQAGDETVLLMFKSRIGTHGHKTADKLANTAADERCMSSHFGYDQSNDYAQ